MTAESTATSDTNNNNDDNNHVNISEWIANAIADTGCRVVYGGHGGALVPLVNAVVAHPSLTWVCARNEHDAATMAAAHAKMTGGLGCVIATSGPGATNLTTGLLEATLDRVALLAITGMKPTAALGYSEFQDVNQSRIFAGAGIEWSKDAASPHAVLPLLRDAVATALSHRTCVHLSIPVDIQAAPSPLPLKHFCASHADVRLHPPRLDSEILDAAAQTLVFGNGEDQINNRPPRNVIAVGLGAVYHGETMSEAVLDLAEALNAPVLTRLHAKGVVDETHPLSFGVVGVHGKPGLETAALLISTADCVLSIGVEDETLLLCNAAGLQIRKLIEVQPDALVAGTRFNAVHTILGDVQDACRQLTSRVERLRETRRMKERTLDRSDRAYESILSSSTKFMQSEWDRFGYMAYNSPSASLRHIKSDLEELVVPTLEELGPEKANEHADELWDLMHEADWKSISEYHGTEFHRFRVTAEVTKGFCHPSVVLRALSKLRLDHKTDPVSANATITVDVGDVTLWASLCLLLKGGSRTLYSERLGTMGYALNAAIAAIMSSPSPAGAVVLAGDGGFQMTLQELATFQQMKRPGDKLLCIVFDNQILGRVAFGFDDAAGCELTGPDYVKLVEAYGGKGVRLDDSGAAEDVVRNAMSADGLYLIHVIVDPEVKADMASFKDNTLAIMNSG